MKDGVIEQLDTPANIVLNPATDYVRKFTQEVTREKVLKIKSVMDPIGDQTDFSDLTVSGDAIIETVAESILDNLPEHRPMSMLDQVAMPMESTTVM
jgi:glycine betaine/proline transport system ATP-binding protein